jgi:hypothetical protein
MLLIVTKYYSTCIEGIMSRKKFIYEFSNCRTTSKIDSNAVYVTEMLKSDCHVNVLKIAEELNTRKQSIRLILTKDLK